MSVRNMFGVQGVRIISEAEIDSPHVLGRLYPEGSVEAFREAEADKLLAMYASKFTDVNEAIERDLAAENFDFGNEIYVETMSSAESRRMTERFLAVRSFDEMLDLVAEYDAIPAARELSATCMLKHGWDTDANISKYRLRIAV